jgi:hypothetical protein
MPTLKHDVMRDAALLTRQVLADPVLNSQALRGVAELIKSGA